MSVSVTTMHNCEHTLCRVDVFFQREAEKKNRRTLHDNRPGVLNRRAGFGRSIPRQRIASTAPDYSDAQSFRDEGRQRCQIRRASCGWILWRWNEPSEREREREREREEDSRSREGGRKTKNMFCPHQKKKKKTASLFSPKQTLARCAPLESCL
jgi:hypothetical protein